MKIKELFEEQSDGLVGFRFSSELTFKTERKPSKFKLLDDYLLKEITTELPYDFQNLAIDLPDSFFVIDLYINRSNQFNPVDLTRFAYVIENILENTLWDYGYSVDGVNYSRLLIDYPLPFIINDFQFTHNIKWEFQQEVNLTKVEKYFETPTTFSLEIINDRLIKGNVLGFLKIKHLSKISGDDKSKWISIINKYLSSGKRDILACQDELIESGFKQFAKL